LSQSFFVRFSVLNFFSVTLYSELQIYFCVLEVYL
jgi:hypothetical protein